MYVKPEPKHIPGMIERGEQDMLTNLGRCCDLSDPSSIVVEIGTFFGRSTASLVRGLLENSSLNLGHRNIPPIFAYDSFSCALEGGNFSRYVNECALRSGLEHLLRRNGAMLDFKAVFDHFLAQYEAPQTLGVPLLTSVRTQLANMPDCPGNIALMHIDAPKHYEELEPILEKYFPQMLPDGMIVFQDFFYHWSGSLIACIAILVKNGLVCPAYSVASSLACEVSRTITPSDIQSVRETMRHANIPQLISLAQDQVKDIAVDRRDEFLPRLRLAEAQIHFEEGRYADAKNALRDILVKQPINQQVLMDLLDLVGMGFSILPGYKRDHAHTPAHEDMMRPK